MAVTTAFDFFIQWHLTEKCNLRCTHCYQEGKKTDDIPLPEIREVINEVSDMLAGWKNDFDISFAPSFNVTGGEPFLRKDLFEILQVIRDHGFDIYLLTNGTLINDERTRRLAEIGVKGVQVSIEGPEKIHDAIRGKGSFSSSLNGVRSLLDAGNTVTLNMTLSDINADYFMDMVSLSTSLGVQKLGFSRLVPSGRGAGMLDKMIPEKKVQKLYENISRIKVDGLQIVTGDPIVSQMSTSIDRGIDSLVPVGGCAAGVSGLTLLPDGTVTPCRRLPIPIGNVRKDPLREIWATSEVLGALRDRSKYKGKCASCSRWADCRGCRAIAYAWSSSKGVGDMFAEDPQCFITE